MNKLLAVYDVLSLVFLLFQILDGITRLGSLYVQICNAGCTLFQNWKAVFFCSPQHPMLTVIEFGKDGKHKVCSKTHSLYDVRLSCNNYD